MRFRAVMFDFGHTLFDTLEPSAYCERLHTEHGLDLDEPTFTERWAAIQALSRTAQELAKGRDLSAAQHRECWLELLQPLDELGPGIADFIYTAEISPAGWRP